MTAVSNVGKLPAVQNLPQKNHQEFLPGLIMENLYDGRWACQRFSSHLCQRGIIGIMIIDNFFLNIPAFVIV